MAAALALSSLLTIAGAAPLRRPHIWMNLQDDFGWFDWNGPPLAPYRMNLKQLAHEGIVLTNHLVHYHCSPTRRSFLSGRLPIHHGEMLSGVATDDLDLRWTLISGKLQKAGYSTHWVGKGHTGYRSVNHLPTNVGFDSFTGFLSGSQSYTSSDRWRDSGPLNDTSYSSDLFGQVALAIVEKHTLSDGPLFLYLPWQAVHSPYNPVPGFDCEAAVPPYPGVFAGMLNESDAYVGKIAALLKQKDYWANTLVVGSSDNGGVSIHGLAGINYPLRGEKHTTWAGGYRVAAFVSGGVVPKALHGSTSNLRLSIVDW